MVSKELTKTVFKTIESVNIVVSSVSIVLLPCICMALQ